jgi:iron complex transport system substrate-binding protein
VAEHAGTVPARIVSLLPSLTEIVWALGLGDRLVGRSHECDHPASVSQLPRCTEPSFEPTGTSGEIDASVRTRVERGLSVYRVDADRLAALAPDLVLTQDHCAVCAASLADVERAVCEWVGGTPQVVSVAPSTLAGVWESIATVANACGVAERGRELAAALTDRITAVGERAGALTPKPTVATVEWLEPLMTGGNWMPELVALAGGRNLFGRTGAHSPWTTWEELRAADPDTIVVVPCGFDLARTRAELALLTDHPEFAELRAARSGRVALADGNAYFNRPGPRLVDSLEILAEMLHPEHFDFGHRGRGWEPA